MITGEEAKIHRWIRNGIAGKDIKGVRRFLTPERLATTGERNRTLFLEIVAAGLLEQVPAGSVTSDLILAADAEGTTALHLALATKTHRFIPQQMFTLQNMLLFNDTGWTPTHAVAQHGLFQELDSGLFTERTMSAMTRTGRTPMHVAACVGKLGQVPKQFLTPKFLRWQDTRNETPIYQAIEAEPVARIPTDLLTRENLDLSCRNKLQEKQQWDRLPESVLWEIRNELVFASPGYKKVWEVLPPELQEKVRTAGALATVQEQLASMEDL